MRCNENDTVYNNRFHHYITVTARIVLLTINIVMMMKMAILMATRLLDQVLNEKVFQPLKMQEQREAKSPTPTL